MVDLDHNLDRKFPILFFPIRIETKYDHSNSDGEQKWSLRLRFFPDQIIINNFDPRLTRVEVEDARAYWKALSALDRANADAFVQDRNSEWTKLTNKYGLPRAAYIAKSVIDYDPDSDPDPVTPSLKGDDKIEIREEDDILAPICKLLPTRFFVRGLLNLPPNLNPENVTPEMLDDLAIEASGRIIPDSLSLHPFQDIGTSESDNWITNFDAALEKGMALEIELDEEDYKAGFQYIIVYGVRGNLSPDQTKQEIENLFRAHRYTEGLGLVKQGTPTNLVKTESNDESSFFSHRHFSQSDVNAYRSVEFASLEEEQTGLITGLAPDGRILEKVLGLDHVANGLLNANCYDQATATCMSYALWPSVLGYFMKKLVNIENLNLESLQNHFVRYVSAQGIVPPIRVGKTPYGILPITSLSEWEDKNQIISAPNNIGGTNHVRTFFSLLKKEWTKFVDQVPTVMNTGVPGTENLLNILSMEAISHTYYVRGFRSLNYITDFIFEILKKNETYEKLKLRNKRALDTVLKTIFEVVPKGVSLDRFYDLCPGSGISELGFPMVSDSEQTDTLDPNYIEKIFNDIEGPDSKFLETSKKQTGIGRPSDSDPLLFRLLRYSASLIGETKDPIEIKKFAESLQTLRFEKPDRLKAMMLQTLDLVSYRLDAWISSFANQRLDHLRQSREKGLYAGAFGWVENLMPKEQQEQVSFSNGGYIQAPSYAHAAAAAVLRNGYLTHSNDQEKKDLFKINLNSERTKNALEIITGIENIPLSELLGYRLERRLHDAEIDYLIDEFRKHFPLKKDDRKELDDPVGPGQERIEPRNLTDGLTVFKNWKRLTDNIGSSDVDKIENFMKDDHEDPGWKSFYIEMKNKYGAEDHQMTDLITSLKRQLNILFDEVDGMSDLCIAESVFQAVSGNYLRSGAVLDGMSGDGHIPVPEISSIPRSGTLQVQRIALAIEVQPLGNLKLKGIHDSVPWESPRKFAEPNFSKLIDSYIGRISFWIDLKDVSDIVTSTEELGLTDLGLEAIDLLYMENSELEARLNYYCKSRGFTSYDIRYEQQDSSFAQIEKRSLRDLQFLIKALQGIMAQGQPLRYSDFMSRNDMTQEEVIPSIKEIFQRYYDIILLLLQTIKELELAKSAETVAAIENKRHALIKAGFFASDFAVPINSEGNLVADVSELNDKIGLVVDQLKSRLPEHDDQAEKLLDWKTKLEKKGEEVFLESLVDELTKEPKNERKYSRTVDILVEQIKKMLNNNSFLILPPFTIPSESSKKLKSSAQTNTKVLKWIGKASYVRPRLRFLDEIITHNQILESANFSFYYDETKFMQSAEFLAENKEEMNPVSIILAISTETAGQEKNETLKSLVGVVADEWTDKIVSKEQDTYITFHYNAPSTEAPQCLLLAVSPNDLNELWDKHNIFNAISETLELAKLRGVDYRSLGHLRHFLPVLFLNSHGEDIFTNLFQAKGS